MKKYLIEKDGVVKTFGLNEINVKNQYSNLNNIKEYEAVAVPQFDKRVYSCREVTPVLVNGKYKQQFELFEVPLNTGKINVQRDLENKVEEHILERYSRTKQASDTNDKEYWGAWLIYHFPTVYTSDNIYSKMFASAKNIFSGTTTLQDEVTSLQEVTSFIDVDEEYKYPIALEQLLKVSIRQGWVQACKAEYYIRTQQVNSATTITELEAVVLNLPGYPL